MTIVSDFISSVKKTYATGQATEHSYRSALETLFNALDNEITALNEPRRVQCGAPDFIVSKGDIVIGHVEAKDLHIGLRGMKDANKHQQERYKAALPNLIYTNCLDWDFYRNGELVASITIADLVMGVQERPERYETLENLLRDFIAQTPQTITTPKELAERMAGKANLIKDILGKVLREDKDLNSDLTAQYEAFKENLIHDITPEDFSDIYAETIAYGMFAARLHDPTIETFSRQEAWELLPKSNPFLRDLFLFIAGPNLDDRLRWIIDELAKVFLAADVKGQIMKNFGKLTGQNDPFLHFYETFLAAYNPAKRKARGVWYTPEPVVNFIVRAVDEVLQTEFGLPEGLADTSKVTIDWDTGQRARTKKGDFTKDGKNVIEKREVHRVQILDPATGTGTFLAEVIKQIAPKIKNVAPGMWSQYIEQDLIPRLHGFELLMASYAMCHMKLDMILTEMGYQPSSNPPRLSVYLTNSLEEGEPANQTLPFTQWLSREAKGANTIKRDMPIMCVIGNPPYLGEGGMSEGWFGNLMDDYKKEPGGRGRLQERNPKMINDLYVKFIRLSSHLIEKNGEGVLGFITNHGYIDNPTFRGMRWHLLKTFNKIWILDLHGNSNKKEVTPEGKPDKNVFDIQQGVSIILGVKKKDSGGQLAEVKHAELWGSRSSKYAELLDEKAIAQKFVKLQPTDPFWLFTPIDYGSFGLYKNGFSISQLFIENLSGIVTGKDSELIGFSKSDFPSSDDAQYLEDFLYRPLDLRIINYDLKKVQRPRLEIMRHLQKTPNFALVLPKQAKTEKGAFVANTLAGHKTYSAYDRNYVFPLFLYPDEQDLDQNRRLNFEPKLYKTLQTLAGHPDHGTPDEIAVFDYIYGVLHCPAYRETYAEFLKIDFPRIPWPTSPDEFWEISDKGTELRKLHLMDPATIGQTAYPFMTVEGKESSNEVDKPSFKDGKVWINETQYFDNAPEISWGFYIGGYQPAQKWLKDRKGRVLSFDDVKHYQRILKILSETDRIMKTITMTLS